MARLILEQPCEHDGYVEFGHVFDGWDSRSPEGIPPPGKPPNHYCDGPSRTVIDPADLPSHRIEAAARELERWVSNGSYAQAEAAIRAFLETDDKEE